MYKHADRIQQSISLSSEIEGKGENIEENRSRLVDPFLPFLETSSTPWHILEQRYYSLNKERLEEELNSLSTKASVDISLMDHRLRRIAAALEVEKYQRRALEDRMYAKVSTSPVATEISMAPNSEVEEII